LTEARRAREVRGHALSPSTHRGEGRVRGYFLSFLHLGKPGNLSFSYYAIKEKVNKPELGD